MTKKDAAEILRALAQSSSGGAQEALIMGADALERKTPKLNVEKFKKFYSLYPRKEAIGAAEKAFAKIDPDDELLGKMIKAVSEQVSSGEWTEKRFIPLPATWLNQRRWENEAGGIVGYQVDIETGRGNRA